jgi:hypothetical protein
MQYKELMVLCLYRKSYKENYVFNGKNKVGINAAMVSQQKLFYTISDMGKRDELHYKIFRALQAECNGCADCQNAQGT